MHSVLQPDLFFEIIMHPTKKKQNQLVFPALEKVRLVGYRYYLSKLLVVYCVYNQKIDFKC
jgi:hypothetical protein